MRTLLISYDLASPGRNYTGLYETIKGLGAWCHYLQSTWIITTTIDPESVADQLRDQMDANDGLLVVQIHAGDPRHGWLPARAWQWLDQKLQP